MIPPPRASHAAFITQFKGSPIYKPSLLILAKRALGWAHLEKKTVSGRSSNDSGHSQGTAALLRSLKRAKMDNVAQGKQLILNVAQHGRTVMSLLEMCTKSPALAFSRASLFLASSRAWELRWAGGEWDVHY